MKTTATTVLTNTPHKVQLENKVSCQTKKRKYQNKNQLNALYQV
jgi:hypothetical protein